MQLVIPLNDDEAKKKPWLRVHGAFADLVDAFGAKEICYLLNVKNSQLADSLAARSRHRVPAEWIVQALTFDAPPKREDLVAASKANLIAALCDAGGYEGAKIRVPVRPPAVELDAMTSFMAEKFPGALEQYRKERR